MPEENTPVPAVSSNAPKFVDSGAMDAARELTRLNAELAKEKAAREAAETRAQTLESNVDEKTQKDMADQLAAAKAENEQLKADGVANARKAELTGKVADVDAALKLLDADKHIRKDGSIDVDALLADRPFLAPAPTVPAATAPDGGGGSQSSAVAPNLERAADAGDIAGINAAFNAALNPTPAAK